MAGFKMTVRTAAPAETFIFGMKSAGGTVDCVVDWGDGSQSTITAYNDADLTHEYAIAGDYDIEIISGTWTAPNVADVPSKSMMYEVKAFGTGYGSSWDSAFSGAINLTVSAAQEGFGAGVTTMVLMFYQAATANPDTSDWEVSSVTSMGGMFQSASSANPDVSGWDVSNVTSMSNMVYAASFSNQNYDAALLAWSQLTLQNGVSFHAGAAAYSVPSAREVLTDTFGWTITDGGQTTTQYLLDGFLWYLGGVGGDVVLNDGTTTVQVASADEMKIGVAYGDGLMQLTVNGVSSAEVPYDGSLLVGTLTLLSGTDVKGVRNIRRYDVAYDEGKTIIDGLMA